MRLFFAVAVICPIALGGSFRPEEPLDAGRADAVLQYDDGSGWFFLQDQTYRATWFDLEDFYSDPVGFEVEAAEFWFYHHSSYHAIWATDFFVAELWNGGSEGPATILDSSSAMAVHMTAAYVEYPDPITTSEDFWFIAVLDTWNGTPSPIADYEASYPAPHCFYSSDMVTWEPLSVGGEYLFRMHGNPLLGLEPTTWAAIKALF